MTTPQELASVRYIVNDVPAAAAGGSLVERSDQASGRRYAYVADPDGYVIEL